MEGQSAALFRTISLPLWAVGEIAQTTRFRGNRGEPHIICRARLTDCAGHLLVTQKKQRKGSLAVSNLIKTNALGAISLFSPFSLPFFGT